MPLLGYMLGLGVQELALILLIVMLLFGATKVPQLMRGLGQGVREFKSAVNDKNGDDDDKEAKKLPDKKNQED